jgi:hypothetical protein
VGLFYKSSIMLHKQFRRLYAIQRSFVPQADPAIRWDKQDNSQVYTLQYVPNFESIRKSLYSMTAISLLSVVENNTDCYRSPTSLSS